MSDLRDALRTLRATPVVSAVAILSLALGIGANTAFFSLFDSLMLRALPVQEPHRLVMLKSGQVLVENGALRTDRLPGKAIRAPLARP